MYIYRQQNLHFLTTFISIDTAPCLISTVIKSVHRTVFYLSLSIDKYNTEVNIVIIWSKDTNKVWQLVKWLLSSQAQTRMARPLSNKTQMHTAQDIADDLSFYLNNTYILLHTCMYYYLLQNWVWSYYAVLKIRSNAEIVRHEQTVITRVAGDIQSSSRRNSGGRRLVLKPLPWHILMPNWSYYL